MSVKALHRALEKTAAALAAAKTETELFLDRVGSAHLTAPLPTPFPLPKSEYEVELVRCSSSTKVSLYTATGVLVKPARYGVLTAVVPPGEYEVDFEQIRLRGTERRRFVVQCRTIICERRGDFVLPV